MKPCKINKSYINGTGQSYKLTVIARERSPERSEGRSDRSNLKEYWKRLLRFARNDDVLFIVILVLTCLASPSLYAQDGKGLMALNIEEGMEIREIDGHRLLVPKDAKVWKEGGVIKVEDPLEYTNSRLSQIDSRLTEIEETLSELGSKIEKLENKKQPTSYTSSRFSELESRLKGINTTLDEIRRKIERIEGQTTDIQGDPFEHAHSLFLKVDSQLAKINITLTELKSQMIELKYRISAIEGR